MNRLLRDFSIEAQLWLAPEQTVCACFLWPVTAVVPSVAAAGVTAVLPLKPMRLLAED